MVFFDDILIYSHSWSEHLSHIKIVLEGLSKHQLYVKASKCTFGQSQVEYFGHIISVQGVAVDHEKIQAGTLGLTGYYKKFVHGYGQISFPLTQLLKKDAFLWNKEADDAFEKLKAAMSSTLVICLPDFSKPLL